MASSVDTHSIVRVRPLTSQEAARIPESVEHSLFMGDGSLSCAAPSPMRQSSMGGLGGVGAVWREVVGGYLPISPAHASHD